MPSEIEYGFDSRRQSGEFIDWSTFLISILLVTIGLISIYSATYDAGMSSRFSQQLIYACLGYGMVIVILFIPETWIFTMAYPVYGIMALMLISVKLFGHEVNGTTGWLNLGFVTIQPAELAKVTTLLAAARYLSSKGIDIKNLRDFLSVSGIVLFPAALIFIQPDHGTSTVIVALLFGILFWAGFDLFTLFTVFSIPAVGIMSLFGIGSFVTSVSIFSIAAGFFRKKLYVTIIAIVVVTGVGYSSKVMVDKLEPYQKKRIEIFLNPGSDLRGSGYNVNQSILAVGGGRLTGKGFLGGTQTQLRYIPAQWTDFIFSVPAEEFGFVGAVSVILLIAGFIIRAVSIAGESDSNFLSLICFGAGTIIFYHTVINIGMAIGLMPVMGIPLPFLSSGGSFLISDLAIVGLLLNAYRAHRRKKIA